MQRLVMVQRADRPEHTPEAEGLLVDTDDPMTLRLVLDDGTELVGQRAAFVEAGVHVEGSAHLRDAA